MRKRNIHLTDADHQRVSDAVAAAERETDGEIVTIVTDLSEDYDDVAANWSAFVALLALGAYAFFPEFYLNLINIGSNGWHNEWTLAGALPLLALFVTIKYAAIRLLMMWMPLRLALTPGWTKTARVRARAIRYFKVGAESRTAKRTGVLLYLSLKEHRAEIVADEAVHQSVPEARWGHAMAALVADVRDGRPADGIIAAIGEIGAILAEHFPKDPDDPNELPDKVIEL